jgi:multisubunit Na+/H+ antiporter MnhB subunit
VFWSASSFEVGLSFGSLSRLSFISLDVMPPNKKRRRKDIAGAAVVALFGMWLTYISHQAQIQHTVVRARGGSWYTPEVGYVAALCFFVVAAVLLVHAIRKSNDTTE